MNSLQKTSFYFLIFNCTVILLLVYNLRPELLWIIGGVLIIFFIAETVMRWFADK